MSKRNLIAGKAEILQRTADALDIPADALAGVQKILITGNRRVHIENHRGIIEYDRQMMRIAVFGNVVKIRGENLELDSMNSGELLIRGVISGVEFES